MTQIIDCSIINFVVRKVILLIWTNIITSYVIFSFNKFCFCELITEISAYLTNHEADACVLETSLFLLSLQRMYPASWWGLLNTWWSSSDLAKNADIK